MWYSLQGRNDISLFREQVDEAGAAIHFPEQELRLVRAMVSELGAHVMDIGGGEFAVRAMGKGRRAGLRIQVRFSAPAIMIDGAGEGVLDEFGLGINGAKLIADYFEIAQVRKNTVVTAWKWNPAAGRAQRAVNSEDRKAFSALYYEVVGNRARVLTKGALDRAYEFGRVALARGLGITDIILIHTEVAARLQQEAPYGDLRDRIRGALSECLAEASTPYEIQLRASRQASSRVREVNSLLEQEPRRIARILHDDASQMLGMIYCTADMICLGATNGCEEGITRLKDLLRQTEEMLRSLSREMRPVVLEELGLGAALRIHAQSIASRRALQVEVIDEGIGRLPPLIELTLYRIVQEALGNVLRHSGAKIVQLRLKRGNSSVKCSVSDDGKGFDVSKLRQHGCVGLGLVGMRERAGALKGNLHINSEPGKGTTVEVELPLRRKDPGSASLTQIRAASSPPPALSA
jgi:signal transduction histidine kinase